MTQLLVAHMKLKKIHKLIQKFDPCVNTEIQEGCLYEDRKEWRRLCYNKGRVDRDTRGVLLTGQKMDKALSKDKSLQWTVNVICGHIQFSLYLVALSESYPKFFNSLL